MQRLREEEENVLLGNEESRPSHGRSERGFHTFPEEDSPPPMGSTGVSRYIYKIYRREKKHRRTRVSVSIRFTPLRHLAERRACLRVCPGLQGESCVCCVCCGRTRSGLGSSSGREIAVSLSATKIDRAVLRYSTLCSVMAMGTTTVHGFVYLEVDHNWGRSKFR